ncbi:MAG: phosphate/phosphite/phosphonate ABC transporter substrate-binding protein, partial [Kiloniellales bacterium]
MSRASLPMYDLPEVAAATDAWWRGLACAFAREGIADPPAALTRLGDHRLLWRAGDLLFTQTCGYPLTHAFADAFALVATPCYASPDCEGPRYRSLIVTRAEQGGMEIADLRGLRLAVNGHDSHSGANALRALVAPLAAGQRFFANVLETGGHLASLAAVTEGSADVCAVDCVTFALLARYRPAALATLRVFARTPLAPG